MNDTLSRKRLFCAALGMAHELVADWLRDFHSNGDIPKVISQRLFGGGRIQESHHSRVDRRATEPGSGDGWSVVEEGA